MRELIPCPFCGGAPKIVDDNGRHGMVFSVWHQCESTGGKFNKYGSVDRLTIDTGWYDSEQEAIDVWNTRAEQTCEWTIECCDYDRTSYETECSEPIWWESESSNHPDYCPGCGRKVKVVE